MIDQVYRLGVFLRPGLLEKGRSDQKDYDQERMRAERAKEAFFLDAFHSVISSVAKLTDLMPFFMQRSTS